MPPPRTLAAITLFRDLPAEAVKRLDARCVWRDAHAKEWIVNYEEEGTDVFFVVAGEVRVLIQSVSGREVILADLKAGAYFGEMAAIDGLPRSASIRALTNATVARMSAVQFRDAVHEHRAVADRLLKTMVARMRGLLQRVNEFSSLDVRHRIYAELLRLSKADPSDKAAAVLSPPPSHSEIAARVSTARELVARELKALERAGLLARRRGALLITDTRQLVQKLEDAREGD
jgi:CRP-like cAMP-binding protein